MVMISRFQARSIGSWSIASLRMVGAEAVISSCRRVLGNKRSSALWPRNNVRLELSGERHSCAHRAGARKKATIQVRAISIGNE